MILNTKNKKKIAIDRIIAEGEILHIDVKLKGKDEEEKYTLIATTKPTMTIENNNTLGDGTTKTIKINYPNIENVKNYYTLDGRRNLGRIYRKYKLESNKQGKFLSKNRIYRKRHRKHHN